MLSATNGDQPLSFESAEVFKTAPQLSDLPKLTAFVEAILEKADCPLKVCLQIDVVIDEAFSNIARYSGASFALVQCFARDGVIALRFSDDGMPYDPLQAPEPDFSSPAEARAIGGWGIYMIKKTMDEVTYSYENNQNVLTLIKRY